MTLLLIIKLTMSISKYQKFLDLPNLIRNVELKLSVDTSWLGWWSMFENIEELLRCTPGIWKNHSGRIYNARISWNWSYKQEYFKASHNCLQSISWSKGKNVGGVQVLGYKSRISSYQSYLSCLLLLGYWILQNDLIKTWQVLGILSFAF